MGGLESKMRILNKIDDVLTAIEENIIAILLFVMMGIAFYGVIARFILHNSLSWGDESSRYLSIWAVFIGASLGIKKGAHIGVEAFVMMAPQKVQKYIMILTTVIGIAFCCAVTFIGFDYTLKLLRTGQMSPGMRIPIVWAYAAVPVGCLLMTLRYIMQLINQIVDLTGKANKSIPGGDAN